jgi:cardiolipin synthase A/B
MQCGAASPAEPTYISSVGSLASPVVVVVLAAVLASCRSSSAPENLEGTRVADGLAAIGAPLLPGNDLTLIENGAVFDAMARDIERARVSVNIVTYIWRGEGGPSEQIGAALLARRSGVACRIVIDPYGSLKFSDGLEKRLEASGCQIRRYVISDSPGTLLLARNHRKIQIVDGKWGITGGFGIWKSWQGNGRTPDEWRDTAVRAAGPVVAQMQRAFEKNWKDVGGAALPAADFPELARAGPTRAAFVASSPREGAPSPAETMTHLLVGAARRRLVIANSYFIPDDALQKLVVKQRREGVRVQVLAPGPVHDVPPVRAAQRDTYQTLLEAGVRVFEYQPSMMHAKTMVVDGRWVVIGSTNFDQLSFDRLEEGSLVADARHLARQMVEHIEDDIERSKEITPAIWRKRDLLPEIARRAAGLFSDWL